ncbi:MAG: RNA polymerase subunit sigma-24 [Chloroflexi bacterium]|nr:MAG: RNA polymerase subunit sigma-24 [Chloroflexota bacterium]
MHGVRAAAEGGRRVDDRPLVAAVLDGDRDAFRLVVDREASVVYRACIRILGDPHDAEDVAQESFLIAYRSLGSFRAEGSFGAWLMRIATRQAFLRLRKRSRMDALDLDGDALPSRSAPDPLAIALAGERQRAVRDAVARLPDPYREVVALRFFGEQSLEEIALTTHRPLNTIKTHLRRGLERLRLGTSQEALA